MCSPESLWEWVFRHRQRFSGKCRNFPEWAWIIGMSIARLSIDYFVFISVYSVSFGDFIFTSWNPYQPQNTAEARWSASGLRSVLQGGFFPPSAVGTDSLTIEWL